MKIAILNPKADFTPEQQQSMASVGEVVYLEGPMEQPIAKFKELAKGASILAVDPDNFGGFEKARAQLVELMDSLPDLKALELDTTSFGWVDFDYCKKKNISVSNCPGWSRESIAEHSIAMLLNLARNIIKMDRKTQAGEYKLEMSKELNGKTLGIIGTGNIGTATAKLGRGIGMKVIGYNRTPEKIEGIEMKDSLDELLAEADAISIHITHEDKNKHMIGEKEISKMKDGVVIANLADREGVDEGAMAQAIKSGKVFGYAYEGEDLEATPLKGIDNAIGLKGFGWFTKEALAKLYQVWADNIVAAAKGKPQNVVS